MKFSPNVTFPKGSDEIDDRTLKYLKDEERRDFLLLLIVLHYQTLQDYCFHVATQIKCVPTMCKSPPPKATQADEHRLVVRMSSAAQWTAGTLYAPLLILRSPVR